VLAAHELENTVAGQADAVAALGVAGVVVWISLQLGRKAVDELLDSVPPELGRHIADAAKVADVREVKQVRVRRSGPGLFVDLALVLDSDESLERSHEIADRAEAAIKAPVSPCRRCGAHGAWSYLHGRSGGDGAAAPPSAMDRRHTTSACSRKTAAGTMELHLEMAESLPLGEAHRRLRPWRATCSGRPGLANVITHIEPSGERAATRNAEPAEVERIRATLLHFPELVQLGIQAHDLCVRRTGHELAISFHCTLGAATSIKDAHASPSASNSICARKSPTWDV